MRKLALIPLLFLGLTLAACSDVTGIGARGLEGSWDARIDGETVRFSLREERDGLVRGSGYWGRDNIYVTGERYSDDVYLVFEFDYYNPIELEGRVRSGELEGWLYGSGYNGERVVFRRQSRW